MQEWRERQSEGEIKNLGAALYTLNAIHSFLKMLHKSWNLNKSDRCPVIQEQNMQPVETKTLPAWQK